MINTKAPTTPNSCKQGYTPYWYGCYKIDSTKSTWEETQQVNIQYSFYIHFVMQIHSENVQYMMYVHSMISVCSCRISEIVSHFVNKHYAPSLRLFLLFYPSKDRERCGFQLISLPCGWRFYHVCITAGWGL